MTPELEEKFAKFLEENNISSLSATDSYTCGDGCCWEPSGIVIRYSNGDCEQVSEI